MQPFAWIWLFAWTLIGGVLFGCAIASLILGFTLHKRKSISDRS